MREKRKGKEGKRESKCTPKMQRASNAYSQSPMGDRWAMKTLVVACEPNSQASPPVALE
jgi:hypothetical protein